MYVPKWAMAAVMALACMLSVVEPRVAQAQINTQFNGDYDCTFAERMVGSVNNDIVQQTFSYERDLNHEINPGSSNSVLDALAACTGLSFAGLAIGFQLPTIEAILGALINQLINAACSAIRRQVSRITSLFPSIPCYRGCNFGVGGLGLTGNGTLSGGASGATGTAPQGSVFSGDAALTPSQQWDALRPLFQPEAAPGAQQ